MNGPDHPQRLRLAAVPGSPLASGLAAAHERGPSDAQLRALQISLAVTLGATATGVAVSAVVEATSPVAPTVVATATLKVTAALVALVTTASGVAVYRHAHRAAPASITAATSRIERRAAPSFPPTVAAPTEIAIPAAAPLLAGAEHHSGVPHPRRAVSDSLDGDAQRVAGTAAKRAAPDELALIARAQRTLANDPAAALALIEENGRPLAQSAFVQEAEVIAVAALTRLGRTDEARARARRFVARFPDSVHASRMRRVAAIIN